MKKPPNLLPIRLPPNMLNPNPKPIPQQVNRQVLLLLLVLRPAHRALPHIHIPLPQQQDIDITVEADLVSNACLLRENDLVAVLIVLDVGVGGDKGVELFVALGVGLLGHELCSVLVVSERTVHAQGGFLVVAELGIVGDMGVPDVGPTGWGVCVPTGEKGIDCWLRRGGLVSGGGFLLVSSQRHLGLMWCEMVVDLKFLCE